MWNREVWTLLCKLANCFFTFIQVTAYNNGPFLFIFQQFSTVCGYTTVCSSYPCWYTFELLPVWVIMYKPAMNFHVQVYSFCMEYIFIPHKYTPMSEIIELSSKYMFNFIRTTMWLYYFTFPPAVFESSKLLHNLTIIIIIKSVALLHFSNFSHYSRYKVVPHCSFNLPFPDK